MINKKDTTDMNFLTDILKAVLKPLLEKYLAARKERKELERFYNTWSLPTFSKRPPESLGIRFMSLTVI